MFGDPLHAAAFPIPQFHFQIGDFTEAADLLFDVEESAFQAQIGFEAIILFWPGW